MDFYFLGLSISKNSELQLGTRTRQFVLQVRWRRYRIPIDTHNYIADQKVRKERRRFVLKSNNVGTCISLEALPEVGRNQLGVRTEVVWLALAPESGLNLILTLLKRHELGGSAPRHKGDGVCSTESRLPRTGRNRSKTD